MSVWTAEYREKHLRLHSKLRRLYGRANVCVSYDCRNTSQRFCWAKIAGRRYTTSITDYQQLCTRCHYLYDRANKENLTVNDIDDVLLPRDFKKENPTSKDFDVQVTLVKPLEQEKVSKDSIVKYIIIDGLNYVFVDVPKDAIDIHVTNEYGERFIVFYNLVGQDGFAVILYLKYFGGVNFYPDNMEIVCHLSNPTNEIKTIFERSGFDYKKYENKLLINFKHEKTIKRLIEGEGDE